MLKASVRFTNKIISAETVLHVKWCERKVITYVFHKCRLDVPKNSKPALETIAITKLATPVGLDKVY